ncbi:hypothetical protein KGR20_21530 [Cytobacillus oceanisediminis]|uniref:Uncharacterized protein n=2 Tax=Niallia TaxID=2837506 RepID=A0A941JN60_NIACI|nr:MULTISPECIES: hypothetical protein [Bacillaceae]EOR22673.1 hypothetical protein A499_16598 [Niallia nealsonii AAU1]MBQ6447577.1 hypothetical protein [Bacillus sp. (in: firmicutes)]MDU1848011.1 hypothetical protein [Niallia nealsonii]HWJ78085.1 hypothetical protein [Niallia sp.]MBZ9536745.1 hypothetical protein [Cytobacillus oceanisediminis]
MADKKNAATAPTPTPFNKSKKQPKKSMNPNRRKMTVAVSETFEDIHDMNKKALNLLAKRA